MTHRLSPATFLSFFLFALLLSVSVETVSAKLTVDVVTHDTDVQSTYQYLKVCSCGGTTDVVRIKNVGMLEANYVLSLEGDQTWFTLERSSVYLMPGESADVRVYTQVPCGLAGLGHYKVYVASEYGRYRAIDKTIETGVCENVMFDVTPDSSTLAPCDTQDFDVTITNVGTFRDTYSVKSTDELQFHDVMINAGETKTVRGSYVASCSEWGDKTFPITVTSQKNGISSTQVVGLTVPRAYDYSIEFGTISRPVCEDVTNSVPVIVKNLEDRANTIALTGSPYSTSTYVYLEGKSTAVVNVPFSPDADGSQGFTVRAVGLNGTINKEIRQDIPVEACFGFKVEAPSEVTSCPGELTVPFTITSEGTELQNLTYDVRSNTTLTIDGLEQTLRPSQQYDKDVTVHLPDADREYYVTLNVNSTYANAGKTTAIHAYSTESCYEVTPTAHKFRVWTDQYSLPVIIKHTGIQPGNYMVHYDGHFIRADEANITLSPSGQAILHLKSNPEGFETGRYIDRLTLSSHGVDYTTDFEITLAQKGFWQQFLDACRWNGSFGVCSVTSSLSFVIMLIVILVALGILVGLVHYENPVRWSRETIGFLLGAVLVILLLLMIVTVPHTSRALERPLQPSDDARLFYEIGQGDTLILPLAQYFADPDNDSLTFTASQPEHLLIKVEHGFAYIKPKAGFNSQDTLVFTATDRRNAYTDSDVITVSVVRYKPVTFLQYWTNGCWFYTFLFLFISVAVVTLVLLTGSGARKKRHGGARWILHTNPQTEIVPAGEANALVESTDTRIRNLPKGTKLNEIGQVIGTQVQAGQIIINQGQQGEQLWVASADGTRFHKITCPIVKGMPREKRVTFATREDAIKAGYTPCKTCSSHD